MGSTGTGNFTDYPGSQGAQPGGGAGGGERSGSGDGGGDDLCLAPIAEVALEEVERCAYFTRSGGVPPPGTDVDVLGQLSGGRLAVVTAADGEEIGFLPTRLNHLLACLRSGYRYPGEVTASSVIPVAVVRVGLEPTA
jgi:hypothetical protein